ncbi:MAG: AAA family ATPase [Thermodesulfobacteriota bacterium]
MNFSRAYTQVQLLKNNLSKVLLGKGDIIDIALTALLSKGDLLIEDVPGVGKTTLAHGLARSINCDFLRLQFTSDLLPSDVVGVTIFNQARQDFQFRKGPIFANFILADEINRATPKTQSALLEAMSERQVSVDGVTHLLPEPFMLLATQNPVDFSGTFPLPESQLDRFALSVKIGYPEAESERRIIVSAGESDALKALTPVVDAADVLTMQEAASKVRVDEDLVNYILAITRATRIHKDIRLGVSPRGAKTLYRSAQAHAIVEGREYVTPDDIKTLAINVFSHRIVSTLGTHGEELEENTAILRDILERAIVPV